MKKILLSRNFIFLAVFVIIFCIIALLMLDRNHPLYLISLGAGIIVAFLLQLRKRWANASE